MTDMAYCRNESCISRPISMGVIFCFPLVKKFSFSIEVLLSIILYSYHGGKTAFSLFRGVLSYGFVFHVKHRLLSVT